jgi:hypothetical protein
MNPSLRSATQLRAPFIRAALAMIGNRQNPLAMVRADSPEAELIRAMPDMILRAAVSPMASTDNSGALVPRAAADFRQGMYGRSAFDTIASVAPAIPPNIRFSTNTSIGYGSTVAEAVPKPFSRFDITEVVDSKSKVAAQVELTRELARFSDGVRVADQLMTDAAAVASDMPLIAYGLNGAPSFSATGTAAEHVRKNLAAALSMMHLHAGSRVFWIVSPDVRLQLAFMGVIGASGELAFIDMNVSGIGNIAGVTVVASDAVAVDTTGATTLLIDASRFAMSDSGFTLRVSEQATIQRDDAPTNPPTSDTVFVSAFQQNLVIVLVERWVSFAKLGADAAVVLDSVLYSAG